MMIELYYWPTPNGHKITIFCEEAGIPSIGGDRARPLIGAQRREKSRSRRPLSVARTTASR
jgi:hypothetical protein